MPPDHMHGRRRQQLLVVRARQPDVATAAQINAPRALREAAVHPGPQGVLGFERRRLLALLRGLDGLVMGWQPDRELVWGAFRRGTRRAGGARATHRSIKPNANHGIARHIVSRPPVDAGMALGTARLLGVPIDDKGLQVIAFARPLLPAVGPEGRPDDIDLMPGLGRHQEVRIHIATVEHVCARQQITLGQVVMDGGPHDTIRGGGGRSDHLRHQIRLAWITGLGKVQLVAHQWVSRLLL